MQVLYEYFDWGFEGGRGHGGSVGQKRGVVIGVVVGQRRGVVGRRIRN